MNNKTNTQPRLQRFLVIIFAVAVACGGSGVVADIAPGPAAVTGIGDVSLARAAIERGDLHLAMNHLARELDRVPGDGIALTLFVDCVRRSAEDANNNCDQVASVNLVEQLRLRVEAARQEQFATTAPTTSLKDLTRAEEAVAAIAQSITENADAQAGPHIDQVMRLADQAHHWWKPNDRSEIREALRNLRWVCERGQVVSQDTMGRYYEALNRLKGMVANSEWDNLLVEAGYVK